MSQTGANEVPLIGRSTELASLRELVDGARAGRSAGLVVRGEAGIGKSTLLAAVANGAPDLTVVSVRGCEAERDLPYAGLFELCRPLLDHLTALPGHQAAVLSGALALGPPVEGDRFATGVAVLGLLAAAAAEHPVLVVVDDVQWLDAATAEALGFALRRLQAEGVVVLLGLREGEVPPLDVRAIPELVLTPLTEADATTLACSASRDRLGPGDVAALVAAAHGNPLALRELVAAHDAGALPPTVPPGGPLPVGSTLEAVYSVRLPGLPAGTRTAVLVASASATGRADEIAAALATLGLGLADIEPAEAAGLLTVAGGQVSFRHPLARSAVYHAAPAPERRTAHRALADVLTDPAAADRRAWHLAASTVTTDGEVAALLDAVAVEALGRGAVAAAARAYEEAARLSPTPTAAAARRVAAAEACNACHAPARAAALADAALAATDDPVVRARAEHARARAMYDAGETRGVVGRLLAAAEDAAAVDPSRAAAMYVDAAVAAVQSGRGDRALAVTTRAEELARGIGGTLHDMATVMLGSALVLTGETGRGRSLLRRLHRILDDGALAATPPALLPTAALTLIWVEDYDECATLLDHLVNAGRRRTLPAHMPGALLMRSILRFGFGDLAGAVIDGEDAVALAETTGQRDTFVGALSQLALVHGVRGEEEACRRYVARLGELLGGRGGRLTRRTTAAGAAVLDLAAGRPVEALNALEPLLSEPRGENPAPAFWETELAEAYALLGRVDDAGTLLDGFEGRAAAGGNKRALSSAFRCRGMLAAPGDVDDVFGTAVDLVRSPLIPLPVARAELRWGQRLVADGRSGEALPHLRVALDLFDRIEAAGWATQAADALRSLGEEPPRSRAPLALLPSHERQVAAAVARGTSPADIAQGLFLSSATVERRLAGALDKLGVRSPEELRDAIGASVGAQAHGPATVHVLGGFRVERGGHDITPAPGHPARAVKIVAVGGGQVHVDELAEALWPEAPPGRGRSRLRNVLARVRQSSGELLVRRGDLLVLADDVVVDVDLFDAEVDAALAPGVDAEEAGRLAGRAVARRRGDLLEDSPYDVWAAAPRERFRRRYLAALDLLADVAAAAGRVNDALEHLDRAIEVEPYDEGRYAVAARLLLDAGRRGSAVALVRRGRDALAELGVEPSASLLAVEADLADPPPAAASA